jgi:hypothetical protein
MCTVHLAYRQYNILQAKIICRRRRLGHFTSDVYLLDKVGHLMQRPGNSAYNMCTASCLFVPINNACAAPLITLMTALSPRTASC